MHSDYDDVLGWTWWCPWGCYDYGYLSRERAEDGYLHHACRKGS